MNARQAAEKINPHGLNKLSLSLRRRRRRRHSLRLNPNPRPRAMCKRRLRSKRKRKYPWRRLKLTSRRMRNSHPPPRSHLRCFIGSNRPLLLSSSRSPPSPHLRLKHTTTPVDSSTPSLFRLCSFSHSWPEKASQCSAILILANGRAPPGRQRVGPGGS